MAGDMGITDPALEGELDRLSKSVVYIGIIFLLVSSPGLFNTWHTNAYVFIAAQQQHFCKVPDLAESNWTLEQQRVISAHYKERDNQEISGCEYYNRDYNNLTHYSFEDALKLTKNSSNQDITTCGQWYYRGEPTAVQEWDLVCDRLPLRSTVQTAVALGKFLGAFVFGFVADKWGRRTSCVISYVTYMLFGLLSYFSADYWLFFVTRVALGMAGSGTFNTGFTLLTELCNVKHRAVLGLMYNMSYPLGMLTLSLIAYLTSTWRILQLCLVLPMFVMILHFIILPESPRWLLSQGRKDDAWKVVKNANRFFCCCPGQQSTIEFKTSEPDNTANNVADNKEVPNTVLETTFMERLRTKLARMVKLFSNREIVGRLLICWSLWFVTALTYYTLSLSSENFETDTHVYVAISGVVEAVSYILPIPLLKFFGRRLVTSCLFIVSGFSLLLIIAVPTEMTTAVMVVAMIGRLCTGAVYSVVILYTAELFPTVNRSSAVGTSSTLSHLGGVSAAYIVDLLGAVVRSLPSTICGLLAFTAGLMSLLLPETKDKDLCDTVEQMMENAKRGDKVTVKNCCACCC